MEFDSDNIDFKKTLRGVNITTQQYVEETVISQDTSLAVSLTMKTSSTYLRTLMLSDYFITLLCDTQYNIYILHDSLLYRLVLLLPAVLDAYVEASSLLARLERRNKRILTELCNTPKHKQGTRYIVILAMYRCQQIKKKKTLFLICSTFFLG